MNANTDIIEIVSEENTNNIGNLNTIFLGPPGSGEQGVALKSDSKNISNISYALRGKLIIFVIGGPGSGKGTQCDKIVKKYGFKHLSSGDLLRAEVESESELGQSLNEIMREGKLVPLDVILTLLKNAILSNCSDYNGFLIDGYPREVVQGERFESEIASCNLALYLHVCDEVMTQRLLERGKTSSRADDNAKTIQNRINLFYRVTKPVIDYYMTKGKIKEINSEQTPDDVFADISSVLDELVLSTY